MKTISDYLRLPHLDNCDCSVCWSARQVAKPVHSLSTQCDQCRPAFALPTHAQKMGKVAGEWTVLLWNWSITPAFICAKHEPSRRPPKYWHVVQDTGKPTPFVPLREFQHEF